MKTLLILSALLISACDSSSGFQAEHSPEMAVTFTQSDRFKVERVAVFRDDLAHYSRRGVYVIKDSHTGKEFIGISGVGISELGQTTMSDGKTTTFHDIED